MGWLREKYIKGYFTGKDENGNSTPAVAGVPAYEVGSIRDHNLELLRWVNLQDKQVLDIGFGRGEMLKYAVEHGAAGATGVDFSEAAYELAKELFEKYQIDADIYCDDALSFVDSWIEKGIPRKFDIVTLFDAVEHIPRSELSQTLTKLHHILNKNAIIMVNTPSFGVDNDVIKDGLNPLAMDTSDEQATTAGMHCNRYTKESLKNYMSDLAYPPVSGHIFVEDGAIPKFIEGTRLAWLAAIIQGYSLRINRMWQRETYEHGYTFAQLQQQRLWKQQPRWKRFLKRLLKAFGIQVSRIQKTRYMEATSSHPGWVQVNNGILKGTNLFLDISSIAFWAGEMANGNYDQPLFDQIIANTALEGKVVWDVGAHIGYHSLMLAKMVGDTGQVIAFEPNPYNISRFNMHLEKNPELASRITLNSLAISNKDGEAQFEFSPSIDIGTSSGSHLKGASTPYAEEIYKDFGRMMVNVAQIDTLVADMKTSPPSVIKVDVEGAECELLEGARNVLQTHRPILFIEIHSAANVFHVQNFLNEMGYRISLIEDAHESPMRCFIMAKPRSKQI